MRRAALAFCGLAFSAAAAQAQSPFVNCPSILSRDAFLAQGGKLVARKLPPLPKKLCASVAVPDDARPSKVRFETHCYGSVQFHTVVRPDGSVKWGSVGHVRDAGMSPILSARVDTIRFAPPRLGGAPVCVLQDVLWESAAPGKFSLVGETP